jgi:predicted 3-demethylubiquinone-9 3-methyltransferase (glyoxalase superfamily)
MQNVKSITPCLWFDSEAEDAARFYTTIFPASRVTRITHYGREGQDIHGRKPGTVQTVAFTLGGNAFTALNGGPLFKFNEAISLQVECRDQEEVDFYWERLSKGADPKTQHCGWLKDKFGLSWQVVPAVLPDMLSDPDPNKSQPVMRAMLQMKKLDIAKLKEAYDG